MTSEVEQRPMLIMARYGLYRSQWVKEMTETTRSRNVTILVEAHTYICILALCLRPPLSENKQIEVVTIFIFSVAKHKGSGQIESTPLFRSTEPCHLAVQMLQ